MPRVKVSITDVYNAKDHAMGFDSPRLVEAAEKAIAWLVQQTGVDAPAMAVPTAEIVPPAPTTESVLDVLTDYAQALEVVGVTAAAREAADRLAAGPAAGSPQPDPDAKKAAVVERMAKARAARAAKRNVTAA